MIEYKTTCFLCHHEVDTTARFISYLVDEGVPPGTEVYAHTSCFDADYTGKEVIDLDRKLIVRPKGVLLPYEGEEEEIPENIFELRRK